MTATRTAKATGSPGFTLIELLVVVAIISLLVSILLPSLQKARDHAKSALCMSNQKQFGIAATMYMSEYSDTLPPIYANSQFFFYEGGSLGRYLWPNTPVNSSNPCSMRCPSYGTDSPAPPRGGPMTTLNVDICYFDSWAAFGNAVFRTVDELPPAGGVLLMRDVKGHPAYLELASYWCTGYYSYYETYLMNYWDDRHLDGFVSLFVDGHVSWQRRLPSTLETWGKDPRNP